MPVSIYDYIDINDLKSLRRLIQKDLTCLELRAGELNGTPLMCACLCIKTEAVKILLDEGADIYAVDSWGENVLHNVVGLIKIRSIEEHAEHEKIELLWGIIRLLLEREAQLISEGKIPAICLLESKTNRGRTPLDMVASEPEIHARLLAIAGEVTAKFARRDSADDLRLFSQPQATSVTRENNGCFAGLFHLRQPQPREEEESPLIARTIGVVNGGHKKVD